MLNNHVYHRITDIHEYQNKNHKIDISSVSTGPSGLTKLDLTFQFFILISAEAVYITMQQISIMNFNYLCMFYYH